MQRAVYNCATIHLPDRTDVSGRVTADEDEVRRRRARERRSPASAMVAGGVPSAGEHDFPATASRNLSLRMPLLLNFGEFEKCSRCSVGYRPTIEAVCIPIDKIVALITESLLL
jgi:hypothetical protein